MNCKRRNAVAHPTSSKSEVPRDLPDSLWPTFTLHSKDDFDVLKERKNVPVQPAKPFDCGNTPFIVKLTFQKNVSSGVLS